MTLNMFLLDHFSVVVHFISNNFVAPSMLSKCLKSACHCDYVWTCLPVFNNCYELLLLRNHIS